MEYFVILTAFVYLSLKNCISAQPSSKENMIKETFCELNSVTIDCGTNNVIALQQVQYGYAPRCSTLCCQAKESGDCVITVTDTTDFKRVCSGQSSCNPPVVSSHELCSYGRQAASYVYIEYYCISESRITSVCSSNTITSAGEPLYLTNPGYPGATIGTRSCSCSYEAQSCSTGTSSFIIDADLYSDPNNCLQSLRLLDNNDTLIESIQCENFYNGFVKQNKLLSNYIKVNFESNTTQNLEGYVFIGFIASEYGTFSLTCSSISATWCIDCGIPNKITNGIVALDTRNNHGFNSTATVTCNPGFNANTSKIVCHQRGNWESVSCTPTDRSESGIAGRLAGVVVGSVLGTLTIIAAVYFIRRCLRNSQPTMTTGTSELEENDTYNNVSDVDSNFTRDVGVPNVYESLKNAGSDQHY